MIPKPEPGRDTGAERGTGKAAGGPATESSTRVPTPEAIHAGPALPRRLVLDTNVCLDLFVFRDPRWAALLAALQRSDVRAFTRADCRMEWTLVLGYARLGLDSAQQAAALAEFDELIALQPDPGPDDEAMLARLPSCRDPDDQKFIALAASCGADALVTKDKLVLKLARKMKKLALFRILSPEQWSAEWQAAQSLSCSDPSSDSSAGADAALCKAQ